MSEPDILSEVHPVADLCSHFRDPEPTTPYGLYLLKRQVLLEVPPCADIGSCRHLTIRSDCHAVTPAMRSAVLSAPIMRHSKSGGVTECLLSRAVGGDSLLFHSNCSHSG